MKKQSVLSVMSLGLILGCNLARSHGPDAELKSTRNTTTDVLFSLDGQAASELHAALWGSEDVVKSVSGMGSIYCEQNFASFPDGAQGIIAPGAYCSGYPHVEFPDGAQGIVAPWFTLHGLAGYQMFSAMPGRAEVDPRNRRYKTLEGELKIHCDSRENKCDIGKVSEVVPERTPIFEADGQLARDIFDALTVTSENAAKKIDGNMHLSCTPQAGRIPAGAQGIAAPSARCVLFPIVEFPEGAQGIVAPLMNLNGYSAYQLYEKLPLRANRHDGTKVYQGHLEIDCESSDSNFDGLTMSYARCKVYQ
jgi:hypothetical protein